MVGEHCRLRTVVGTTYSITLWDSFHKINFICTKKLFLFIYNSKVDGSRNQIRSGFYFLKYFLHKLFIHKAYFIIILKLRGPSLMTFAMTFMHLIATCRYNTLFHNITRMSQFESCDFIQRKWTEQYVLIICTCMYIFRSRKSRLFSSVRSSATRGSFFYLFHNLFSMPFIHEYLSIIIVWIKFCSCSEIHGYVISYS